jgi:prolyl-tRNA synthetase
MGSSAKLRIGKAVEIGHIFKLGYRYAEALGAHVLDPSGKEVTLIMGSYGIGIERILTAAIEQSAKQRPDAGGFVMPPSIAPFQVVVTVTNVSDDLLLQTGEQVAAQLEEAGFDVLLDDRDERAGVKFKDADLVGIPYRVTVGKKAAEGKVELLDRTGQSGPVGAQDVAIGEVASLLRRS